MVKMARPKKAKTAASKKSHRRYSPRKLSSKQERAYRLVCLEGLTQQEAGDQMGCSKQNISQLLQKARPKIEALSSQSGSLSLENGVGRA